MDYVLNEEVSILDFYQLICFLMQIPAEEHDGDWDNIEDMLKISSANYVIPTFNAINVFVMLMFTHLLIH